MEHDLYLIQCDHMSGGMCYYAEHGEKCGVPDAVGYDTAAHARKFRTYEDAQTYIDTQMPEWARPSHHPASYRSGSFIMEDAGLRALLNAGVPISDAMLSELTEQPQVGFIIVVVLPVQKGNRVYDKVVMQALGI